MAVAAYALTTLAAAKAYASIEDDERDTVLEGLIDAYSRFILTRSGREFAPAESAATRRVSYHGTKQIHLRPYDATAITSITLDPDGDNPVEISTYQLRPIVSPDNVFTWIELDRVYSTRGFQALPAEIVGDFGWPSVPADLVNALHRLVKETFVADLGWSSDEFDDLPGNIEASRVPLDVLDTIESYVRGPVAVSL